MSDDHTITITAGTVIDTNENNSDNQANVEPVAGASNVPEDTTIDGYRALLDKQEALISTLLGQVDSYQKQIETLVRNGANYNDGNASATPAPQPASLSDDYTPLADLGADFGKR